MKRSTACDQDRDGRRMEKNGHGRRQQLKKIGAEPRLHLNETLEQGKRKRIQALYRPEEPPDRDSAGAEA